MHNDYWRANCTSALYTGVGTTISRRSLLSPFPEFGSITTTNNDGESWYHSVQLSLQKRFSKGYGLQFAYTRSKWIEAIEYLNAADAKPTKMIGAQDVPNRFSMSAFYEFPFGKGQRFLSHGNWLVNAVVGGWQIEGTYTYQSGFPLRFANDAFYLGGKIAIPKSQQTLNRAFNTDAFVNVSGSYIAHLSIRTDGLCKLRHSGRSPAQLAVLLRGCAHRPNQQR